MATGSNSIDTIRDADVQPAGRALKLVILLLCLIALALISSISVFEWLVEQYGAGERAESDLFIGLSFALIAVVGALAAMGQPRNAVGWVLLFSAMMTGLAGASEGWRYYTVEVRQNTETALVAGWLGSIGWVTGSSLLLIIFPFLFPNGRLPGKRWRPVFATAVVLIILLLAMLIVAPLFSRRFMDPNEIDALLGPFFAAFPAFGLLGVVSLIARYRGGNADVRQQTKWLLLTVGAPIVVFALLSTMEELIGLTLSNEIWGLTYLLIPIGLGISLLRYRLFDVDTVIRKTVVYAVLTFLLALIYLGSIVTLQRVITPFTGESDVAVVLSTLAIAALFLPLRRWLQAFIDRRFFRRKYDAEQVLARFAATSRDETDLDLLTAELLQVIQETMEPEHVSVWLRPADWTTSGRPREE